MFAGLEVAIDTGPTVRAKQAVDQATESLNKLAHAAENVGKASAASRSPAEQMAAGARTLAEAEERAAQAATRAAGGLQHIGAAAAQATPQMQQAAAAMGGGGIGGGGGVPGLGGAGAGGGGGGGIAGSLAAIAGFANLAANAFRGFLGGFSLQAITSMATGVARTADAWELMEARVRLASGTLVGTNELMNTLRANAREAGISFQLTVDAFTRLARTREDIGATNAQIVRLTEITQKLGIVSGGTTGEIASGMLQLSQALAAGRLNGDELRSIMENMPALAKAIAEGLGVSVGRLRQMGEAGELLSSRVLAAILSQGDKINEQFAKMPETLERATTRASDAWSRLIARIGKEANASPVLQWLMRQSENFANSAATAFVPTPEEAQMAELRRLSLPGLFSGTIGGGREIAMGQDIMAQMDAATIARITEEQAEKLATLRAPVTRGVQLLDTEDKDARKRKELESQIKQVNEALKALDEQQKAGAITAADYANTYARLTRGLAGFQAQLRFTADAAGDMARELARTAQAQEQGGFGGGAKIMEEFLAAQEKAAKELSGSAPSLDQFIQKRILATREATEALYQQADAEAARTRGIQGGTAAEREAEIQNKLVAYQFATYGKIINDDVNGALRDYERALRTVQKAENDRAVAQQMRDLTLQADNLERMAQAIANGPQAERAEKLKQQVEGIARALNLSPEQREVFEGLFGRVAKAQDDAAFAQRERSLRSQLDAIQLQVKFAGDLTDEQKVQLALEQNRLDLLNRGIDATDERFQREQQLTAEIARANITLERQRKAEEMMAEPFKNALRGIQSSFSDFFESVFSGGIDSFKSLAAGIKSIFIRLAAEVATLLVFKPIVGGALGSLGLGGIANGLGLGGFSGGGGGFANRFPLVSGTNGGGFSIGDIFSVGKLFGGGDFLGSLTSSGGFSAFGGGLTGAAGGNLVDPLFGGFSAAGPLSGVEGALSGIGGLGGALGIAGGLFSIGSSFAGGNIAGGVGGIAGGALGALIGGPVGFGIGAGLGSLIGGLFGGKKKKTPQAVTDILIDNAGFAEVGRNTVRAGGNVEATQSAAGSIAESINAILDTLGGSLGAGARGGSILTSTGKKQGTVFIPFLGSYSAGNTTPIRPSYGQAEATQDMEQAMAQVVIAVLQDAARSGSLTGVSGDALTALKNSKAGPAADLQRFAADIEFGQNFQSNIAVLTRGVRDLSQEVDVLARQEVAAATKALKEFKATTAELGLNTEAAANATKAYVEVLYGIRDPAETLSETATAWAALTAKFEAANPLFKEVGLSIDLLPGLLESAREKFRDQYNDSLARDIRAITDPLGLAMDDLLKQQEQRLKDVQLIGGDIVEAERLNMLERLRLSAGGANLSELAASLRSSIDQTNVSSLSPLSPAAKLAQLQDTYGAAYAAVSGGDLSKVQQLLSAREQLLGAAQTFYGGAQPYSDLYSQTTGQIAQIATVIETAIQGNSSTSLSELFSDLGGQQLVTQQSMLDELSAIRQIMADQATKIVDLTEKLAMYQNAPAG